MDDETNPPTQAPGAPSATTPSIAEPTEPPAQAGPPPAKPEQATPEPHSPTGAPLEVDPRLMAQRGGRLTTSTGTRLRDTDHSLRAGDRGPILLQDHHLREKITHFDHERIPERVVHARGAGAHGVFVGYGTAAGICRAGFLAEGVETPVFTRFSTVIGSRGSADTVRDTRGFATKFYTAEGVFDLVGNNIPVFFIQDGIKFPDVIHAAKWHPDREIPQAQTAHDTFWDFVSLHTEAQHHTMWAMSDRGIPRSYRMMEGFGVHTFRTVADDGSTRLVKFHWKPRLGVHSLVWEEAQETAGADPDFHRRDLYDAIEAGALPSWELGVQVFEDTPEQTFGGIDLLDPTKLVPEELAPVQPVGRLTLTATPTNFFAESEQVAFHVGNLVPGIDVTDDPLLQVRLFSYVDTQLTRLGGPNYNQIPVNRTHAPVDDMLRDGTHQTAVHGGVAPYRPNSLDGGCPVTSGDAAGAFVDVAQSLPEGARKVRDLAPSFDDHFSQARQFWVSMSDVERSHIVAAYAFELGKCYEEPIRERQLTCLARIDAELCAQVADALGLPAPEPTVPPADVDPSPALSQVGRSWPVEGRLVGVLVDEDTEPATVEELTEALAAEQVVPLLVAPTGGPVWGDRDQVAHRTLHTVRSVELDAVVVVTPRLADDARVRRLVGDAAAHGKVVGVVGDDLLAQRHGLPAGSSAVVPGGLDDIAAAVLDGLARHRTWAG